MSHHSADPICPLCEVKLGTAHPTIAQWYRLYVKPFFPDAHVSWAWRSQQDQNEAYAEGKSKLNWPHSKHNHMEAGKPCALALDLFEIDEDGVGKWRPKFFREINDQNEIVNRPIAWGGLFKTLGDYDHFELLQDVD